MNFASLVRGVAKRHPDQVALVAGERRFSFRDFWRQICDAAELLRDLGVAAGDRVLLVLPNSPEFLFLHFGAFKMGAISVPVKADYRSWELAQIARNCRPRLMVSDDLWLGENAAAMGGSLEGVEIRSVDRLPDAAGRGDDAVSSLASSAVASINYAYSGGGYPKGAVLTHGNHIYAATGYARHQGFTPADRFLIILPMAHVYALSGCVNSGLISGATLVLGDRYTPKPIFGAIESHAITVLSAVPTVYQILARFPHKERFDLSSLRLCVTGGDFMPEAAQRELEGALGFPIVQGYGLTECLPIVCNPPTGRNKRGTLGIPGRRDIEVRIVGLGGRTLSPGEEGEIAIRSPTTMRGYYRRPRDTAEILRDGWLHTGDLGRLDEEGYLHFCGMTKGIFNISGNKVDPLEVAGALLAHPAVAGAEVRADGAGDPEWTIGAPRISAEVTLRAGQAASATELRRYLRGRIAAYKVPGRIAISS